jgi:hypothetical protein
MFEYWTQHPRSSWQKIQYKKHYAVTFRHLTKSDNRMVWYTIALFWSTLPCLHPCMQDNCFLQVLATFYELQNTLEYCSPLRLAPIYLSIIKESLCQGRGLDEDTTWLHGASLFEREAMWLTRREEIVLLSVTLVHTTQQLDPYKFVANSSQMTSSTLIRDP